MASRVWARWRELEEFKKPSIALLLTVAGSPRDVAPAVEAACSYAIGAREERRDPLAEWRIGACRVALAPRGVLIEISEGPDDFEGLVRLIVQRLEHKGLSGTLDLLGEAKATELPDVMPLIECRTRVRGERYRNARKFKWRADPDALWRAIQGGAAWCAANSSRAEASISVGGTPRFRVDTDDGLEELLRDALARAGFHWFSFATCGGER